MRTYTEAFKKGVVAKALLKPGISPRQTAKEVGVSSSAMYIWIKQYGSESPTNQTLPKAKPTDWSKAEQFNILLATAHLSNEARGAYCRQRGLYQHQLDQWREMFMKEKEASCVATIIIPYALPHKKPNFRLSVASYKIKPFNHIVRGSNNEGEIV